MIDAQFWKDRRVFITGHTGFKGAWLVLLLKQLGAEVTGFSLAPPTSPSLFDLARVDILCRSVTGDIRDRDHLTKSIVEAAPEIIFHLAAQPLVGRSYLEPEETYSTNVMGTLNVLQAVRTCPEIRAVINVTTDKCYENKEWPWGYREIDRLGGHDPYASSKACSELLTASFRSSFFSDEGYGSKHHVAIATARAGNVIGGGDWANDRLIPDCVRALIAGRKMVVRNPHAVRPWQHVLEPLSGYMTLAQVLCREGCSFAEAWNFGPGEHDSKSVEWVMNKISGLFSGFPGFEFSTTAGPKESVYLRLECSKAHQRLGWKPRWDIDKALHATWEWVDGYLHSAGKVKDVCFSRMVDYMNWKQNPVRSGCFAVFPTVSVDGRGKIC